MKIKIVPENPRCRLSCPHVLSTTSPHSPIAPPLRKPTPGFLSSWNKYSRALGRRARAFCVATAHPDYPLQLSPVCPSGGTSSPTTASALVPLFSHFWPSWGLLPFHRSSRSHAFWKQRLRTLQPDRQGFHFWLHRSSDVGHQEWH